MNTRQTICRSALAVCCVLLAGCAAQGRTDAVAGIAVANAAIGDAAAADASRYAGGELESAHKALADANAAMRQQDYERARLLALTARADADLARARTDSAKARRAADDIAESTRLLRSDAGQAAQ